MPSWPLSCCHGTADSHRPLTGQDAVLSEAARPLARLTEGHRGTQSQDSPVVFLMESNPRGLYIFSFNLGHFVSLSENIT